MKKFLAMMLTVAMILGCVPVVYGASKGEIPATLGVELSYFDKGFTKEALPFNVPIIFNKAGNNISEQFGGQVFDEADQWEQNSAVNGAFGKAEDDISFKMRTTDKIQLKSKKVEISPSLFGLPSKTYYELGENGSITLSYDLATTESQSNSEAEKDLAAGASMPNNASEKWPKPVNMYSGKITAGGNSVDMVPSTWYNITAEFTKNASNQYVMAVWVDGVELVRDAVVQDAMVGFRSISFGHLLIKKAGTVTDLYTDNMAMYVNEAFTPERYKANKDAANLSFVRNMIGKNDSKDTVISNLTLPTLGGEGSTISWVSDKANIISDTGVVNRGAVDETVKLTATVTNGISTAERCSTKEFTVTVPKQVDYFWPENAEILAVPTENALALSWNAVNETLDTVVYDVYVNGEAKALANTNSLTVSGLTADTVYNIGVRARNEDGTKNSDKLDKFQFKTTQNRGDKAVEFATLTELNKKIIAGDTNTIGDYELVNVKADITIPSDANFGLNGSVNFDFGASNTQIYSNKILHFMDGNLVYTEKIPSGTKGKTITIITDNVKLKDGEVTLKLAKNGDITGGEPTWANINIYKQTAPKVRFSKPEQLDIKVSEGVSDSVYNMTQNVECNFTFETDIKMNDYAPTAGATPLTIQLQSADGKSVAEIKFNKETMTAIYENNPLNGGANGNILAAYNLVNINTLGNWDNLKLYVNFDTQTYDVYLNNNLVVGDVLFANVDGKNVSKIHLITDGTADYSFKNMYVNGGYNGLYFKPMTVVDGKNTQVSKLTVGTPVTARFSALNATNADINFDLLVQHNNDKTVAKSIINKGYKWNNFDTVITPKSENDNIEIFAWKDLINVEPLAPSGGFIAKPTAQNAAKVFAIGDSTVSYFSGKVGWGQTINQFFTSDAVVENEGHSGKSSKSYWFQGYNNEIARNITKGDYMLIQFGHNDRHANWGSPSRWTDPDTTYKEYLANYITMARQKGVNVIFVTPPAEYGHLSVETDDIMPYITAMKEVAAAYNIPIVDLNTLTKTGFKEIGLEIVEADYYFHDAGNNNKLDGTHFSQVGATKLAEWITADLKRQGHEISRFIK